MREVLWGRFSVWFFLILLTGASLIVGFVVPVIWSVTAVAGILSLQGCRDYKQNRRAVLSNYPIIGHLRFFF